MPYGSSDIKTKRTKKQENRDKKNANRLKDLHKKPKKSSKKT